jgi:aldehyde dehydrogenase (NAD+)
MGPLVSKVHFEKVQRLIQAGIDEGATLVTGGIGRPTALNRGWYVRPTIFADVVPSMTSAQEEIFGPVVGIQAYDSVEDAIAQANDTPYGLAACIAGPIDEARPVARRLRVGHVYLNDPYLDKPDWDIYAPYGGYKQSGNGREYGEWGIRDYCETKAVIAWGA